MVHDFVSIHVALIVRLARRELAVRAGRAARAPLEPEDVAHDVLCSLLASERRGVWRPGCVENSEAYLRRVVVRAIGDASADRRRESLTADGELDSLPGSGGAAPRAPTPEELVIRRGEATRRLASTKARLGPRDALVCALLVEDGLSIEETANAIGASRNAVYQARSRIRHALASVLVEEGLTAGEVAAVLGASAVSEGPREREDERGPR